MDDERRSDRRVGVNLSTRWRGVTGTHQARIEDIDAARAKYAELSIAADLATYLPDMPEQLAFGRLLEGRAYGAHVSDFPFSSVPRQRCLGFATLAPWHVMTRLQCFHSVVFFS